MARLYINPEKDWSSVSCQSVSLPLAVASILLCSPIQCFKRELWQAAVTFFNFQATAVFWQERWVRGKKCFFYFSAEPRITKPSKNVPKTVMKHYFLTPRMTFLCRRTWEKNSMLYLNRTPWLFSTNWRFILSSLLETEKREFTQLRINLEFPHHRNPQGSRDKTLCQCRNAEVKLSVLF